MDTIEQAPNIFGYTDYRAYLENTYNYRKWLPRSYSYRSFSKAAGFTSPNILKLVITDQRNLTPSSVEKFVTGLGLTGQKAEYFRVLIRMNQTTSLQEKKPATIF